MRTATVIRMTAVAAALGVALGASPALAGSRAPAARTAAVAAAGTSAVLQVGTVPVVAGARIILDGVTYLTGADGTVTISTFAGQHHLQVLPPRAQRPGSTVKFSRWLDGITLPDRPIGLHQGINRQQAGFALSYPVRVRFTNGDGRPVPLSAVKQLTMASSLGQRFTFAPGQPPSRLAANRIVRDQFGLHALLIRYSVRNVIFNGANVVYGGSQNFFVRRHLIWTVSLLLFPMHIEVRDALFGFGVGNAVRIRLAGHAGRIVRLGSGHAVTLRGMPRATYELVAKGPGFGLSSPATLTKPLDAKLLLLSWIDIAAVAGFALLFLLGLPILGGRIRRRKDGARLPGWHVGHPEDPPAEQPASPERAGAGIAPAESTAEEPAGAGIAPAESAEEPAGAGTAPAEWTAEERAPAGPAAADAARGGEAVVEARAAEPPVAAADPAMANGEPAAAAVAAAGAGAGLADYAVHETITAGNGAAPDLQASCDRHDPIPRSDVGAGMSRRVGAESSAGLPTIENGGPHVTAAAAVRADEETTTDDEARRRARLAWERRMT